MVYPAINLPLWDEPWDPLKNSSTCKEASAAVTKFRWPRPCRWSIGPTRELLPRMFLGDGLLFHVVSEDTPKEWDFPTETLFLYRNIPKPEFYVWMVSDVEFQPFGRANCWGLAEITSSQSNIWDASYKTWGVKKNNHGIQETQRFFFAYFIAFMIQ